MLILKLPLLVPDYKEKLTVLTHREEEDTYYAKKRYIRDKSESVTLAKDIRIFSLQNWLNDLLDGVHNVYLDFRIRVERILLLADITDVVLTMARNGIAYAYLLNMAIHDGLTVSQFVLYFTAVSTFTTWIMGILQKAKFGYLSSKGIPGIPGTLQI